MRFEWDEKKSQTNLNKHKISFQDAMEAFFDKNRIILEDLKHTTSREKRYYCIGKAKDGILTVRFTYRNGIIRIFGAGYWRKEQRIYEKLNKT